MTNYFRRWQSAWPYMLFLALILFSLRDVLALPGTLGHSWDWDVSAFANQIWGRLSHDFFVWDYEIRAGFYSPFRTGGWYSFLALPFSVLGGEVFSRLFIAGLMFLAAVCMYQFARRGLGLNRWWSTVAGTLYMLSPVMYSRILAGHNLLLPFALLPLLILFVHRTMQGCSENRIVWRDLAASGLLLGLQAIHASMMVLAFMVVGLLLLFALLRTRRRIKTLFSAAVMFAIFGLLNIYWGLPMGAGYLFGGTLYHSGSVIDNPDQVTASSVVDQREDLFEHTTQPMQEALRQNAMPGYATEFQYPVPAPLATLWLVTSFLLPLAAFGILLYQKERRDLHLVLVLSGLIGATLVAGSNVSLGAVAYEWLMRYAFPVWAEFGNTVRALPLIPLAYAALAPALLQEVSERLGEHTRWAVAALTASLVLVNVSPFLAGATLINPDDILALKSYLPSAVDQQLYATLKNDQEDFRITYVPPPWIFYPENYDLGYEWTGGLSPHPEFSAPYFAPQVWQSAFDFRAEMQDSLSGKMLGLGAVKYVVYPRTRFLNPSLGLYPPSTHPPTDNTARVRFVDQVLETQKNLTPLTGPFTGTIVLRNNAYLPHIYAASQSTLVHGNSRMLPEFVDSGFFVGQPAIFFDAQQSAADAKRLASQVDRVINAAAYDTDKPSSFLFSTSPFSNTPSSFVVPRQQSYTIRIQETPFQMSAPRAGDRTTATFERTDAGAGGWSGNLLFEDHWTPASDSLQVAAYLDPSSLQGDASRDEYTQMDQAIEPLNLADYPNLHITSQVENASIQAISVELNLDLDGDGVGDAVWSSPAYSRASFKTDELNVLALVRQKFPDKPQYTVVGVGVRFGKRMQQDWAKVNYPARLYTYGLQEIGFYRQTKPGWTWRPSQVSGSSTPISLTRSLDNLDAQRFPVQVEYDSDGPATLYAEMQLTVENSNGVTRTIPAGAKLIEPFSHGLASVEVQGALLTDLESVDWRAKQIEFLVHRLRGGRELRPTTLTLNRAGARRLVDSNNVKSQSPVLTVDGKPVDLSLIPADADHLRYTTGSLALSQGTHRVSAILSGTNSAYAVESIQVEPVLEPSDSAAPPGITFENINPTRYRVHVTDARSPFFLVFSDNFHANWTATLEPATVPSTSNSQFATFSPGRWYEASALLSALFDGNKRAEISDHYLVNGYANGWHVDKTGSYDIVLEFLPQRFYEGGLIIAFGTFLTCLVVICIAWFKRGGISGKT